MFSLNLSWFVTCYRLLRGLRLSSVHPWAFLLLYERTSTLQKPSEMSVLGCALYFASCPGGEQGNSKCIAWYRLLRTEPNHHPLYLKQAHAKLLTQKLALGAVWQ